MKQLICIMAAFAAAISLTSCSEDCKCNGDEGLQMEVVNLKCTASDWEKVTSEDGDYFTVHLNVPELTQDICSNGDISCFIVYTDGVQAVLPNTRYWNESYTDEETGEEGSYTWQTSTDYEFYKGGVDVYYTTSDFYYTEDEPEAMEFRLVLKW